MGAVAAVAAGLFKTPQEIIRGLASAPRAAVQQSLSSLRLPPAIGIPARGVVGATAEVAKAANSMSFATGEELYKATFPKSIAFNKGGAKTLFSKGGKGGSNAAELKQRGMG